jgi:predicted alpha/beta superfamily hydrolase
MPTQATASSDLSLRWVFFTSVRRTFSKPYPHHRFNVYSFRMQWKPKTFHGPILAFLMTFIAATSAAHAGAVLKDVDFAVTNDVGFGYEACVLGEHPLLGGNDPLQAIKLTWSAGNIWRGTIALPAGEDVTYRFVKRDFNATAWGNTNNLIALTGVLTARAPGHVAAPWNGKTIFLRSAWPQANLLYRDLTRGGAWTEAPMQRMDADRFRIDGIAAGGSEIEFVFNDGSGTWLNAPAPPSNPAQGSAPAIPAPYQNLSAPYNFRTRLDVLFVQNQQVFNYEPPAAGLSPPRIEFRQVGSTVAGIPGRNIAIHLPRGYDENTWKRYPVVYFHDGQNLFFPGGSFGTWDADRIANYETGQGRMRESILVGIDNNANRLGEYMPNGDAVGVTQGVASNYLQFILDNVTPTLDFNYRTLGDAANTITAGSSMGGLVSDYIAFQQSDRFGTAGIFSPAYWAGPNYLANRQLTRLPLRRYIYMGTAESSGGESSSDVYWQGAINAWNDYLGAGHPVHRDLLFEGGAGAQHNEPAWSRRLPAFFAFALDAWREANHLALEHFPPELQVENPAGEPTLGWTVPSGFQQNLQAITALHHDWSEGDNTIFAPVTNFWDAVTTPVPPPAPERVFWRLELHTP